MSGADAAELYSGFSEPLLSFPYLVAAVVVALPLAGLIGYGLGTIEYRRLSYDKVALDQLPGGTSLGAMLALLGLLLGFAFSSALGWHEARQASLVEEVTAISAAFWSADLLDDPGRSDLQSQILAYAQTRLAGAEDTQSKEAWTAFLSRTLEVRAEIWPATLRAFQQGASDPIRAIVGRGVIDMLDAHTRRIAGAAEQVPPAAKLMILLVAVFALLILGNRTALQGRTLTWRTFVFAGVLAVVIIVIFDLDRPLEGAMRVNPDTMRVLIHDMQTALAARAK